MFTPDDKGKVVTVTLKSGIRVYGEVMPQHSYVTATTIRIQDYGGGDHHLKEHTILVSEVAMVTRGRGWEQ
jgi:hypothetical protein